jgi:hypothetical protein
LLDNDYNSNQLSKPPHIRPMQCTKTRWLLARKSSNDSISNPYPEQSSEQSPISRSPRFYSTIAEIQNLRKQSRVHVSFGRVRWRPEPKGRAMAFADPFPLPLSTARFRSRIIACVTYPGLFTADPDEFLVAICYRSGHLDNSTARLLD